MQGLVLVGSAIKPESVIGKPCFSQYSEQD
jgi:hypothetical protein